MSASDNGVRYLKNQHLRERMRSNEPLRLSSPEQDAIDRLLEGLNPAPEQKPSLADLARREAKLNALVRRLTGVSAVPTYSWDPNAA